MSNTIWDPLVGQGYKKTVENEEATSPIKSPKRANWRTKYQQRGRKGPKQERKVEETSLRSDKKQWNRNGNQ